MNILFLNSKKNWAGVSNWIIRLGERFYERNHKIWIISAKKSKFMENAPKHLNIIPKKIGMNYSPVTIVYLIRFIKTYKIDIMVTNIRKEVIAGGIAAKFCGIPNIRLVGNEHDYKNLKFLHKHFVTCDIHPCHHSKKMSLEKYPWIDPDKLKVIHIGINPITFSREEIISQRNKWNINKGEIAIGVTGRLDKKKGVNFLIKAFAKIYSKYKNIKLIITGAGKYKEYLENLVDELNVKDKVLFTGFAQNALLSDAAYDISVLPSLFEAFPYTVVEYFAVGSSVVATNVGGTKEIINDGVNAFLVEAMDDVGLADKLSILIENPEIRNKFRANASSTMKKVFSEDIMIDKTEELFKEIVSK